MTSNRKLTRNAGIVAATLVMLTGCVGGPAAVDSLGGLRPLDGERALVTMALPAFADTAPVRVLFEDPYEREEYVLLRGPGGVQAELVYVNARHETNFHVALEFNRTIAAVVPTWNFNKGMDIAWQPSEWVPTQFGGAWMQPYRLTAEQRNCVGVSGAWDTMSDDPDHRPSKVLFGYYCAAPGQALAFEDAARAIQAIGIRGVTEPLPLRSAYELEAAQKPAPPLPRDKAVELAVIAQQGSPGSRSGHAGFPFLIAEVFQVGGNGNERFD